MVEEAERRQSEAEQLRKEVSVTLHPTDNQLKNNEILIDFVKVYLMKSCTFLWTYVVTCLSA